MAEKSFTDDRTGANKAAEDDDDKVKRRPPIVMIVTLELPNRKPLRGFSCGDPKACGN